LSVILHDPFPPVCHGYSGKDPLSNPSKNVEETQYDTAGVGRELKVGIELMVGEELGKFVGDVEGWADEQNCSSGSKSISSLSSQLLTS